MREDEDEGDRWVRRRLRTTVLPIEVSSAMYPTTCPCLLARPPHFSTFHNVDIRQSKIKRDSQGH